MIKTVIFDIDNTLYDYTAGNKVAMEQIYAYTRSSFRLSREETDKALAQVMQQVTDRLGPVAATHNRLIRYQEFLEMYHLPIIPHAMTMARLYWDTLIQSSVPMPGLIPLMQALHHKGVRIGIGTNMTAMIQYAKIHHLGLDPYIDYMLTSEQSPVEKPDPRFFALCLQAGGFKPEEAIFIGDDLRNDVYGAQAAGLYGLWYAPSADTKKSEEHQDVPRILSYLDCLTPQGIQLGDHLL